MKKDYKRKIIKEQQLQVNKLLLVEQENEENEDIIEKIINDYKLELDFVSTYGKNKFHSSFYPKIHFIEDIVSKSVILFSIQDPFYRNFGEIQSNSENDQNIIMICKNEVFDFDDIIFSVPYKIKTEDELNEIVSNIKENGLKKYDGTESLDIIIPQDIQDPNDKLFYSLSDFTHDQMQNEMYNRHGNLFEDQLLKLEKHVFYEKIEYGSDMDAWIEREERMDSIMKSIRDFEYKINKIIYDDQNKNIPKVTGFSF